MAPPIPNRPQSRMPQWHRYLGITGALFILLLATTGILLNHTSDLELDNHYVQNKKLLTHYGLQAPAPLSFQAGPNWISQLGQRLYLNDQEITADSAPLVGATPYLGMTIVATERALWLLDVSGVLIERMEGHSGLPGNPTSLGLTDNNLLALQTEQGWHVTGDTLHPWRSTLELPSRIITPTSAPAGLEQKLSRAYLGEGLSLERLLLDLHTGRLFGPFGVYLVDLITLILSGLTITGLTLWFKRKHRTSGLRQPLK